jgi:hypothetical protein
LYRDLAHLAQGLDDDFAWALYRKTVTVRKWADDVRDLCQQATSSQALTLELEKRHPEGLDSGQKGEVQEVLLHLLETNRALVTPYALLNISLFEPKHLEIFRQKVYPELWAAALFQPGSRSSRPKAELPVLLNSRLPDSSIRLHLEAFFKNSYACDSRYHRHALNLADSLIAQIYKRFPDLLRGRAKRFISSIPRDLPYEGLTELIFKANDEELIDYLASRIMCFPHNKKELEKRYIDYYDALRNANAPKFTSRLLNILLDTPESDADYRWVSALKEQNPLAIFIHDCASTLAPSLFNGQTPYLTQIARQVTVKGALKDPVVLENHRQTLLPSLLKPTEKKDRIQSFDLLGKLPNDEPSAHLILDRAREAMALAEPSYPKAALLTLIARLLHRWPNLRHAQENPVIYEAAS